MSNIKRKLNEIKRKYGAAVPLAGILTMGTATHYLSHKNDAIENKTEIPIHNEKEMTFQQKIDAFLMPILIMIEGCTLKAYTDDIGVWTYGIGNTKTIDGRPVRKGDTLKDNDEAFEVANHHIKERIDYVFDYIKRDLLPEQKAALKSFAYNCGAGTLVQDDGKLTKLGKAVNDGDDDFVIREMLTYNKAGGSFMRGLFFRRVLEAYVYQGFVSMEKLQECTIGGLGSVSVDREMNEIFNLKMSKNKRRGRRFKIASSYNDAAITDSSVAEKLIAICQAPIGGKMSEKYKNFHIGEPILQFLPESITCNKTPNLFGEELMATTQKEYSCEPNSVKLKENKQEASIIPDITGLLGNFGKNNGR